MPRDVAEPFAEPAGSIRSRALDGRVARLVSRSRGGPASVASSQIRTLRTISVADLQHVIWNDLFNTRFAG